MNLGAHDCGVSGKCKGSDATGLVAAPNASGIETRGDARRDVVGGESAGEPKVIGGYTVARAIG